MAESGRSGAGPLARTLRMLLIIAVVVLSIQVYLNPPRARAEVACYPLYEAYSAVTVDLFQLLIPKAHAWHLKMVRNSAWMHGRCVAYSKKLPGFHE